MLGLAKKLNPEVNYQYDDIRTIRLGEKFDAVMVLDSINYIKTVENLQRTFITTYEHLKPGGVFLTFVEQIAGQFKQNNTMCSTHSQGDVEITFIENYYDPDPTDTSYEATFIYLIRALEANSKMTGDRSLFFFIRIVGHQQDPFWRLS